jgi:hypothetical protein
MAESLEEQKKQIESKHEGRDFHSDLSTPQKKRRFEEYDKEYERRVSSRRDPFTTNSIEYQREMAKSKLKFITRDEFDEYCEVLGKEIPELVKLTIDRETEKIFANARRIVQEEIHKSLIGSPIEEEQTVFNNILEKLRDEISKSDLPNPHIYHKLIGTQKIINVMIDDSENYIDYLNRFSDIINKIYLEYDLDLEILLFEKGEIKVRFLEQGFKEFKIGGV